MKRSSHTRDATNLSALIHHRLNNYALLASAAGVSLLALRYLLTPKLSTLRCTP
jgi:hypothetical protein